MWREAGCKFHWPAAVFLIAASHLISFVFTALYYIGVGVGVESPPPNDALASIECLRLRIRALYSRFMTPADIIIIMRPGRHSNRRD